MIPARDNPFASHRVEALKYRFPGFSLALSLRCLSQQQWRGAIVGPHGSGKTTLLVELYKILQQQFAGQRPLRLWFVPRNSVQQSQDWQLLTHSINSSQILLVDGTERLSWKVRGQLLGWLPLGIGTSRVFTKSIIVTSHRPLLGLPTWLHCRTTPTILKELLLELYPSATPLQIEQAERLFQQFNGNIRSVWWSMYNEVANQPQ